jgi:hypothetical protein
MAVKEATPNKPKNPATMAVYILIGICNPIAPPNTLTKNRNRIPIPILTVACPINLIGLIGAPTNNKRTIKATIIVIMSVELIKNQPLFFRIYFYLILMTIRSGKEPKKRDKDYPCLQVMLIFY